MYLFLDKNAKVLYVGKARDIRERVSSYFANQSSLGEKTKILLSQVAKIKTIVVTSEIESLLLEANLIKKYRPKYNSRLTDGKAYPLIRITTKDRYPSVLVARREEDKNSIYFGPFPNASDMRLVLRAVRRIFPYVSVRNHPKKICLYHHLGLCPCPMVFDSPNTNREYRTSIRRLVTFLRGNTKQVRKELEKERDRQSSIEDFEKAKELQRKIDAIVAITQNIRKPFEFEINPNLRVDIRRKELDDLQRELTKVGVAISDLSRIECFDISNIQGFHIVGSMVVFINGEKASNLYRRFKIRSITNKLPNDFLAMKEVLLRRLKHSEWGHPKLLIVDGGKGQVSAALQAISERNIAIPVIGLAKREESIITPQFSMISLPKDSPSMQLIMRMRDEAHRFAIAYHRKLRSRFTFL